MGFGTSKNGSGFVSRLRRKLAWPKDEAPSDPLGSKTNPHKPGKGPRNVVPSMPRPGTVKRQESERRDRLKPHELTPAERRSMRKSWNPRNTSASLQLIPSMSEGNLNEEQDRRRSFVDPKSLHSPISPISPISPVSPISPTSPDPRFPQIAPLQTQQQEQYRSSAEFNSPINSPINSPVNSPGDKDTDEHDTPPVEESKPATDEVEMDWRWILNLSMHFRDQSEREKFFVTYAETPRIRRRLTISCDYRNASPGTLEKELSMLKFQREKSAKIYEAIRESLTDIQFYDTITNLKLQTSDGRLHVHVTEDFHEIINYPTVHSISHLDCPKICERDLDFESHLSGFVYKVKHGEQVYIKKEIPGPDTVDEFLYEINALNALSQSENVIRFGGCVVDDKMEKVKGLLISFAPKGALIDIVYHEKGQLPWEVREKWAKQIISGLSEIHEAGYVQGDFTLSNIVIDDDDNAKIIDINRRGCPVGWEPPEISAMIEGMQRIGMYIGVKSDIFQLGMCLWGLAHEHDEPEIEQRPLSMHNAPDTVPQWYRDIVKACLSTKPQDRPSAKDLLPCFPTEPSQQDDVVPLSPNIIEAVAPFENDDFKSSPYNNEHRFEYLPANGINHSILIPEAGTPRYSVVGSEDNFEKYEAGIESSSSVKDETFLPLDEVVDDVCSEDEKGGRVQESRREATAGAKPNGKATNGSVQANGNGKSVNGAKRDSGHVRLPLHVDSGFADMDAPLREKLDHREHQPPLHSPPPEVRA